jgi:tripartite-type tricarboxylate transporter receptor subunit TctC
MSLLRRKFLLLSIGASTGPLVPRPASADSLALRPVHIVLGFPPGGVGDIAVRLIAPSLQQRLGQSVVVDNGGAALDCFTSLAMTRSL